jgi:transcriptional regulator with XRE-family HTH domain
MPVDMNLPALAAWMRAEMEQRGWDAADLVRHSGSRLSKPQVSRVLSGKKGVGLDFLDGLAYAVNVPVEEVLRVVGVLPALSPGDDVTPLMERLGRLPARWRDQTLWAWRAALSAAEEAVAQTARVGTSGHSQ